MSDRTTYSDEEIELADDLAYSLTVDYYDAVEREGLRADYNTDGGLSVADSEEIRVYPVGGGSPPITYDRDVVERAGSSRDVRRARGRDGGRSVAHTHGHGRSHGVIMQDRQTIKNETLRLASTSYSIENQARIETLLWVLGYIDAQKCPTGSADDDRVRELTNRGAWPFNPSLGGELANEH